MGLESELNFELSDDYTYCSFMQAWRFLTPFRRSGGFWWIVLAITLEESQR